MRPECYQHNSPSPAGRFSQRLFLSTRRPYWTTKVSISSFKWVDAPQLYCVFRSHPRFRGALADRAALERGTCVVLAQGSALHAARKMVGMHIHACMHEALQARKKRRWSVEAVVSSRQRVTVRVKLIDHVVDLGFSTRVRSIDATCELPRWEGGLLVFEAGCGG